MRDFVNQVRRPFGRGPGVVIFLLFLAMFLPHSSAAAQARSRAVLGMPDASQFPRVTFNMDVYNDSGRLITDLHTADVRVLEDGTPLPVLDLSVLRPGLQFTVAINAGISLANLAGGITQYERIQTLLLEWARTQPASSLDDFSLATNAGLSGSHMVEPSRWVKSLADYKPDLPRSQPNLISLSQAMDLAVDRTARPNMKRAILWVTPALTDTALRTLPNLTDRAVQQGVRVIVWWMAPGASLKTAEPLQQLAERSGGYFYQFSTGEPIPDLEDFLQPLRTIYRVTYQSAITRSGAHSLGVEVGRGGAVISGEPAGFNLVVQPPNPIFLSPPHEVKRTWATATGNDDPALSPASVPISIVVEFPDGHPRPLQKARLYMDEKLMVENSSAPFEQFIWDLKGIDSSGPRSLRVEVIDSLGLSQSSIKQSVDLLVAEPQPKASELFTPQRLTIAGVILLAAGVVAGVFIYTSRHAGRGRPDRKQQAHVFKDPITQPVQISQDGLRPSRPSSPLHSLSSARLVPQTEDGKALPAHSIPIDRLEMTIGSDPSLSVFVVDSAAVNGLHARLTQTSEGVFYLADADSIAGTWLNYAPVSRQGARLHTGDLIHIGPVALRFELNRPGPIPQPQVASREN
jgi:hypothetical protein